ncbi:hypothetical protein [Bradyrhizobium iriomotense]|uniref:Uncharacterized protein n=1 Tax=Bradyrhizobium iriomotense TaxID=441950 RepID=A0ABQ6BB32_9BRAD|nr:hypothetical protein [Bradyrhizobium iriomotense]GLR91584.1 hypothetical protein GCM10007857_83020 [Bradyrhizobium iriomotense]
MSLGCAIAALVVAAVLLIAGHFFPFGVPLTFIGVGLILSLIYDTRYKPASRRPAGPGWVDTGERFIDPETKRRVAVFTRPETGEREYIEL